MTAMSPLRIYANSTLGTGPARPPRTSEASSQVVALKPTLSQAAQIEQEMSRILQASPQPGQSVQAAFDAKERLLRRLFETMSADECAVLHSTLTGSSERVVGFSRLASERRARVLSALAAAPRRRKCA